MKFSKFYYISFAVLLLLFMGACKRIFPDDINVDPTKASSASLASLLPAIEVRTASDNYDIAFFTSLFAQQTAAYTSGYLNQDQYRDVRIPTAWSNIYLGALTNLNQLITQAATEKSPHYQGIGKILQAVNLGLLTDTWGDVPFSEAFQASENLHPPYDPQEQIYASINTMLTDAISLLRQPAASIEPGSDDLIYNGDISKWIETAYVLKARFAIHLTKKGAQQAGQNALNDMDSAYTSNDDNAELAYNQKNLNPWYQNVGVGITTGNYLLAPAATLMNLMNGTEYPVTDPRLPFLADKGNNSTYKGIINGAGSGGTTDISSNTFYANAAAPILIVTYAEQKFIEAEAAFLVNGGTTNSIGATAESYNAYMAGIKANMDELGVSPQDENTYLTNASVAVGASNLSLSLIMKEKLIALYLQPEAWVDVRRYDYSSNIYKGMNMPQNVDPSLDGKFLRRATYPLDEFNRNQTNALKAEKDPNVSVWWDQQ